MFYHVHKINCEKYENLLYLQMQETSTVHEGYSKKKLKPIDVVSTCSFDKTSNIINLYKKTQWPTKLQIILKNAKATHEFGQLAP